MAKKRLRHAAGERYAMLPEEVVESKAYRSLPHFARAVLVEIAVRYSGRNNGDLSFTKPDAKHANIQAWEWSCALQLLEKVGLISKKRQGKVEDGKGVPNLFALTWRTLNASDKYDQPIVVDQPASNEWVKWQRPADWQRVVTSCKRIAQGKSATPRKFPVLTGGPRRSTRVDRMMLAPDHPGGPGEPEHRITRVDSSRDLGGAGLLSAAVAVGGPGASAAAVSSG